MSRWCAVCFSPGVSAGQVGSRFGEWMFASMARVSLLARLRARLVRCRSCIVCVSAGCAALQHRTPIHKESNWYFFRYALMRSRISVPEREAGCAALLEREAGCAALLGVSCRLTPAIGKSALDTRQAVSYHQKQLSCRGSIILPCIGVALLCFVLLCVAVMCRNFAWFLFFFLGTSKVYAHAMGCWGPCPSHTTLDTS